MQITSESIKLGTEWRGVENVIDLEEVSEYLNKIQKSPLLHGLSFM